MSHLFFIKICYNGNGRCVFILVASIERSRWPWTSSSYVYIPTCLTLKLFWGLDPVWGHDFTPNPCQNTLQWRWWVCVYLGCIDRTISLTLDEQKVRSYVGALVFQGVNQFMAIISPSCPLPKHTAMTWVYVYLGWIDFADSGEKLVRARLWSCYSV